MVFALFSLHDIILLVVIFTIMNVVLLAPVVLAVFRTYLEWRENEAIRQSRR